MAAESQPPAPAEPAIPAGFRPLKRTSPFLDRLGTFYYRDSDDGTVYGVRVEAHHANGRGVAHAGFLLTLSDIALGYRTAFASDPPLPLVTASMSADFAGTAKIGDWIDVRVDIQRRGSRLAFANAFLSVGTNRIVRVSTVFAVAGGTLPGAAPTAPA